MERITVDLISSKEFTFENRGYNRKEVDEFLDEICDEMEQMEKEIATLRQQNAVVRAPAPATDMNEVNSFREILEMARKVKDETIRKAQEDADAIRAKAQIDAEERMDGIGEEREQLNRELEALRKVVADYRASFEALLQAQQDALDKATDLF
ncbi:MAG: DivIVA domain-containing protein [Clostridia bacterium]|nr:DivIVA domain-containing protein [Clostridia bacterium]